MKPQNASKRQGISVSQKIFGLVGFLIAASMFVISAILYQFNSVTKEIEEIASEHMPLTEITTNITVHQLEQAVRFERAVRFGEQIGHSPGARTKFNTLRKEFEALGHEVEQGVAAGVKLAEDVVSHTTSEDVAAEYRKILDELTSFGAVHTDYETHAKELFAVILSEIATTSQIEASAAKIEAEEEKLDSQIVSILREVERFTEHSLKTVAAHEKTAFYTGLIMSLAVLVISVPVAFFIVRGISGPLREVVSALGVLGEGDVSRTVKITTHDEIGETAKAYEALRELTRTGQELAARQQAEDEVKRQHALRIEELTNGFDSSVQAVLQAVGSAVTQFEQSAEEMESVAAGANRKSTEVASTSEQASANVQMIAASTEEMSASIAEISEQVTRSASVAKSAVEQVQTTGNSVRALEEAANQIGEVVQLISDIAEQTNLLALNATIEAARAGDAGKGFSVVASEVKELAGQTAKATENISKQIETIQSSTAGAVEAVNSIGGTISDMDEISGSISAAIEEQAATTSDISRNIQQAAQGTQDAADSIGEVKAATEQTGEIAGTVMQSAKALMSQSEELRDRVDTFLRDIKAA